MSEIQRQRQHDRALDQIESYALYVKHDAENIASYSRLLLRKEDFRTKAEAALEEAIKALDMAKSVCETELAAYRAKETKLVAAE